MARIWVEGGRDDEVIRITTSMKAMMYNDGNKGEERRR